jgi:dTDP-4-dehydrorhamnose 3,5-epimerase-like enzyme
MASVINLPTHSDHRGSLTVLDNVLPFPIKRLYWIYDLSGDPRAQHRHHQSRQALICIQGSCEVEIRKYQEIQTFQLSKPDQVLLLEPEDWHETRHFAPGTVMLLVASHHYDPDDYIKEPLV